MQVHSFVTQYSNIESKTSQLLQHTMNQTVSANLAAPTTLVTPNTLALWPQGDQSSATNTIKFLEDNWKYLVSTETQDQYEDQYEQYSQDEHLEEDYHQQNKNQHEYTAQYTVQEINAHTTNKTKISSTSLYHQRRQSRKRKKRNEHNHNYGGTVDL